MEQLKKMYEAIEMLKTLNLPVSKEQLGELARLEKDYLQSEIIPLLKEKLEPLVAELKNRFLLEISFGNEGELQLEIAEHPQSSLLQTSSTGTTSSTRDRTKYSIDGGEPLSKRKFVLAVVKKYVELHTGITYDELRIVFPDRLNNQNRMLRQCEEVWRKTNLQPDFGKRFFLKDSELITLSDGPKVAVCNQWGTDTDNVVNLARKWFKIECI